MFDRARRRTLVLGVAVLTMAAGLAFDTPPAAACSCQSFTPQEFLDEYLEDPSLVLFTGRQIDRDRDGYDLTLTFDVERVFAGDVSGNTTQLQVPLGTSCGGGSVRGLGRRAFIGWQSEGSDDLPHLGVCGVALPPELVQAYVDGFPDPSSSRTPGFVVAQNFLDSRLAVLDQRGRVVRYDRTFDRRVESIEVCPGAESVLVLSTENEHDYNATRREYHLDTFTVADLSMTTHRSFEHVVGRKNLGQLGQVRCHDVAGQIATHIETKNHLRFDQVLVRWTGSNRSEHSFGEVRDIAVNKKGSKAVAVSADGRGATVHDLLTAQVGEPVTMPGESVAWRVNIAARGHVYILGRSASVSGQNRNISQVNQVTRTRLRGLTLLDMSTQPLGDEDLFQDGAYSPDDVPSAPVWSTTVIGDGLFVPFGVVNADGQLLAIFLGPGEDNTRVDFHHGYGGPVAVGRRVTLATHAANSGVGVLRSEKRKLRALPGLVEGHAVAALRTPRTPVTS